MPWRSEVAYLREKAVQFRKLAADYAADYNVTAAAKLYEIAIDLEAKAAEIEARNRPPN